MESKSDDKKKTSQRAKKGARVGGGAATCEWYCLRQPQHPSTSVSPLEVAATERNAKKYGEGNKSAGGFVVPSDVANSTTRTSIEQASSFIKSCREVEPHRRDEIVLKKGFESRSPDVGTNYSKFEWIVPKMKLHSSKRESA